MKELQELKFYMPLTVRTSYVENEYGEYDVEPDLYETSPYVLDGHEDKLREELSKYADPADLGEDFANRGLMAFYMDQDSVGEKVLDLNFAFEKIDGEHYGVAICHFEEDLNPAELETLKEFVTGQAADGLGEGFEQREFKVDDIEVSVSFWNSEDWYLKTSEEMGFEPPEQCQDFGGMGGMNGQ